MMLFVLTVARWLSLSQLVFKPFQHCYIMELFTDVALLSKSPPSDTALTEAEEANEKTCSITDCKQLENKIVALFFSASWCPACQEFTPLLTQMYDELIRRNAPFEIVAVPFDRTKESCDRFFVQESGDWLTVQFDDSIIGTLKEKYCVNVIPKLIVLRPSGEVITPTGRKDVQDKGIIAFRSWLKSTNLSNSLSFL
ncbi:nucleoredoxin-like protein 2 [Liolophura sinensis]|uniref:nucleoredoxin-like protein 2 n=1 Tax=Liolophura sinensis TaxID=3198878 RepID=UPI003158D70E